MIYNSDKMVGKGGEYDSKISVQMNRQKKSKIGADAYFDEGGMAKRSGYFPVRKYNKYKTLYL